MRPVIFFWAMPTLKILFMLDTKMKIFGIHYVVIQLLAKFDLDITTELAVEQLV